MGKTAGMKAFQAERAADKAATLATELDKLEAEYKTYSAKSTKAGDKAKSKSACLRIIRTAKLCDAGDRDIKRRAVEIRTELMR